MVAARESHTTGWCTPRCGYDKRRPRVLRMSRITGLDVSPLRLTGERQCSTMLRISPFSMVSSMTVKKVRGAASGVRRYCIQRSYRCVEPSIGVNTSNSDAGKIPFNRLNIRTTRCRPETMTNGSLKHTSSDRGHPSSTCVPSYKCRMVLLISETFNSCSLWGFSPSINHRQCQSSSWK